jgi:CHASE3 domain sensor protein
MGSLKRRSPVSLRFPTFRFRAKIMLGFAIVLAISAVSMGFAYMGFERVAAGVASYRGSVSEADLARNIDRELVSYRSLARYFVLTAKEEDAKAALAAEASLREAILQSMKGITNPARLEQITKLEREFRAFTKIFATIIKVKDDRSRVAAPRSVSRLTISQAAPTTNRSRRFSSAPEKSPTSFKRWWAWSILLSSTPTRRWPPARRRA